VDTRVEPITEARTEEHADLDLRTTRALVELLNDEDVKVPGAVRFASSSLAEAIDAVVERLQRSGRLVYVGAGSSGRIAAVDAAECGPTFGLAPGRVLAIMAGGTEALAAAQEAIEDEVDTGGSDLAAIGVSAVDAVVAISASGATPYVLGAARVARDAGALTVGVICAEGSELGRLVDHEIVAVVGPEVIAGSTRLKAGTAQKLILNTISTVTMIRLGRTYGNLMVDVVASNAKLRARAKRAVELATDASPDEAEAALADARGDAKVAIVSLLLGVGADEARMRLKTARGSVRRSVDER
jgi:N-acetylmuramic acid 6-phosphate etherase